MERLDAGAATACSLNDAEFRERRALARRILIEKIAGVKRTENALTVTFEDSAALREELEHFVLLERQCCGFLDFVISDELPIELTISGPPEAAATIEMFARAVEGGE